MSIIDPLPSESQILQRLRGKDGKVLNFYAFLGHSPAALEGYLSLKSAIAAGA